jgi:uncharacterized MAPEG superfamily protein
MDRASLAAYALIVTLLTLKYVVLLFVQRGGRMRSGRFRWPEDAAAYEGRADGSETPIVDRAQAALRNDGESQPAFLAASALWLAAGADPTWASLMGCSYAALRWAHGALMLWPRQPARTRVFGLSLLCLLYVLVDSLRLLLSR